MKIADLQNGQTVRCRTGRAGRTAAEYGPWREAALYVQRNTKGRVVIITLRDGSTAEFGPENFEPSYKEFCVEDYYLQIEGLQA